MPCANNWARSGDERATRSDSFEERSRALFQDSVDGLDFAMRSRLTQARNAAIEAASAGRRPWFFRIGVLDAGSRRDRRGGAGRVPMVGVAIGPARRYSS